MGSSGRGGWSGRGSRVHDGQRSGSSDVKECSGSRRKVEFRETF